ncbi:DUF4160 domain-containing protein [endosymbiont GvMRE of Glomus versiforme]|uniref:DUF4160 domain-containing protein n=1 Tax=endosymbiont GvMRE of Glomus versiforme TaxID=2039283 RepID=UPI0011C48812|nr:DUF4160 domain-containing protein [endosymbiont GvMRE of Glomus versiforme]
MPTIHHERGYRFYFNSNENKEPAHVHIKGKEGRMKVWLASLTIDKVRNIPDHEQTKLLEIVESKRDKFLQAWNNFFEEDKK